MDEISVIVPVYNSEKYIRGCVKSIVSQTYTNIKIILVDDGSTDLSGQICDELAKSDSRIVVIHKENGGVMSARNAGIELLSDEGYRTFCDADDYLASNALENMLKIAKTHHADIVCAQLQKFFSKKIKLPTYISQIMLKEKDFSKEQIIKEILPSFFGITNYPGYMHSKLYANSLLKKSLLFNKPVHFFQEDIAFNLQISLLASKITIVPDVVYLYRIGGGTSKFMSTFFEDCLSLYHFKMQMIAVHHLDPWYEYTSAVELKNELYTWLEMYSKHVHGRKNKSELITEIKNVCNNKEIQQAISYSQEDSSGVKGFKNALQQKNYELIYEIIMREEEKNEKFC